MGSSDRIFVSYSRQDRKWARAITRALEERGSEVWDQTRIEAGEDIHASLKAGLEEANLLVGLVSDDSLKSNWLGFEIGAAMALGTRLLPVFLSKRAQRRSPAVLRNARGIWAEHLRPAALAKEVLAAIETASP